MTTIYTVPLFYKSGKPGDMLLTLESEILAYLPTSKWKDAEKLLAVIEEEEENTLAPILGRELFDHLSDCYEDLLSKYGGITPDVIDKASVDDTVRILRTCQKIALNLALSNNSGLFGISFNAGGGMNVVSAEYYESADKDSKDRFERDAWKKAHRNIDILLSFLERDAQKEEPLFADMWKKSPYFYQKGNLLFSTALQMNNYLNIKESRERFIELVPDIKYCQAVYLAPQVGDELMKAFVRSNTVGIDKTIADSVAKKTQEENASIREDWEEAIDRLCTALAGYVEYRNVKIRRADSLSEADMSLSRAIQYISEHQDSFKPYVCHSPFYTEPFKEPAVEDTHSDVCQGHTFDPCDPDNMITVLRPTLRRW